MAKCSFCGQDIEKGTGTMFIKSDGKSFFFCSTKCEKNQMKLKRKPREHQWTKESRVVRNKE
ncbi:50S ribosomal protein L24e [Candidatus Woesearchaeota archaeon]|nr:50S ribosomal protein L24e [Candidatus Woesearchaeota archaeon]